MKLLLSLLSIISFVTFSNGQSNGCAGTPPTLPVNTTCTTQAFAQNENGTGNEEINASCATGTAYSDAWYTVTGTGNTMTITVSGTSEAYALAAFTSCAAGELDCDMQTAGTTGSITFATTNGTTYYIQIQRRGGNNSADLSGNICAVSAAASAGGNDDCGGATVLTVNPDLLCGTTTPGTVVGATASPQDATACFGTENDDVWFSFVATSASHNVSLLNTAGSTTDMYHSVWEGTCPGLTLVAGSCSDADDQTVAGLTPGNTYFVRVYTWNSTAGQTSTFDICIGTNPPPLTITGCSGTFYDDGGAGGTYAANQDYVVSYCSGVAGQCISATFTNFNTESGIDRLTVYDGPNTSSPQIGIYSGTTLNGQTLQASNGCLTFEWHSDGSVQNAGWAANISCSPCPTCSDGILNGQEVGIDCGGPTCPACPCASLPVSNDEACCATPVTVNPDELCGSTTAGTVLNATPSFNATTCSGTDDDDVWFSFVATSTMHSVDILNTSGSVTDMYHAVYGGTCNATGTAIVCSDADASTVGGLTVGNTYFIRVYTYTSTGGQNTTFDVCVGTPPPPPPNALCDGMTPICSDTPIIFTATSGGLDADVVEPGNDYDCLSSSPNPTWFFMEILTSGVIAIDITAGSDVDFAMWGPYADLTTANADCGSLPLPIDCSYSISATEQANTPTAIAGEVYIILVTNYANVSQTITLNSAGSNTATTDCSIVLPITLNSFAGKRINSVNELSWTTSSEINNDYFILERSNDSREFEALTQINGAGNSNTLLSYSYKHNNPREIEYYRLKQVDFNGKYAYSKIIAVKSNQVQEVSIYPNPSKENFSFTISTSNDEVYTIKYTNLIGSVLREKINITEGTNTYQVNDFKDLAKGIYFVQIVNEIGEVIKAQKVIKE